jgi:pimeloyl-ACP methyl ester carboxylesterase
VSAPSPEPTIRFVDVDGLRCAHLGTRLRPPACCVTSSRGLEPPSAWGYIGQPYAISGWTSLRWLGTLPQPTLVLAGDDDPIVPLVNARILARRIPRASLQVIHGGGHLFILERPAATADLVAGFLRPGGAA